MSVPKNSHYIARSLTAPWEHKDRRFCLLELDGTDGGPPRINQHISSKRAFASPDLFSPEMEGWLSNRLEAPFAAWRDRAVDGDPKVRSPEEEQVLLLTVLLASIRVSVARDEPESKKLFSAPLSEAVFGALVHHTFSRWDLVLAPSTAPLFFPETAIFAFPVLDIPRQVFAGMAFYLPVHPHLALGMIPKGTKDVLVLRPGTLQNASIGAADQARRALVAPAALEMGEEYILGVAKEAQKDLAEIFECARLILDLVDEAHRVAGLPLPERPPGSPSRR